MDLALAPLLWPGASDHHLGFFALSLDERTYIDVLLQIGSCFAKAGFRKLFFLNGHGGNSAPLAIALAELRKGYPQMLTARADYWSLAADGIRHVRTSAPGGAAHAGELETSLMLHLVPDSVRADSTESATPEVPKEFTIDLVDSGPADLSTQWENLSPKGAVGRADLASAEKGERFFAHSVQAVAEALLAFSTVEFETGKPAGGLHRPRTAT